ncbi:MAG: arylsulfatase [Gemmatimonadetes bacterium]|nr:arylsulfatase [Gemmatimonadota bacterium]|tara:strand:+ start:1229 stop:2623 length:1395 start_codon:yes stop_codon:yes gene_type:complete
MPDQPNFILFMTDQQRGDCLSADGHPCLLTPVMDSIGGGGTRFRRAYTTCPSCVPARRTLLSGQKPFNNQMVGMTSSPWEPPTTMGHELQKAGYQTAIVGRQMHQYRPDSHYGFEYMREDYGQYLNENQPNGGGGIRGGGISSNGWTAAPWHLDDHLHMSHYVVNEALEFLQNRDRSRPFFLCVSFAAPHPPLTPPAFYMDRYLRMDLPGPYIGDWATPPENGGIGLDIERPTVDLKGEAFRSAAAGYFGLINHVDDQIYRVIDVLKRGRREFGDTVTMHCADHGEMLGDHYLFRKTFAYEASARVPLLMSMPASFGFPRDQVSNTPVCLEDIMPTVLDLAGCEIPENVDGKSLVPILRGDDSPNVRDVLHGEHARCYDDVFNNHFLTDGREKFIWLSHTGQELLFDLENDPQEMHNLATDSNESRVKVWRDRMVDELKDRPEGFVEGGKLVAGKTHVPIPPSV